MTNLSEQLLQKIETQKVTQTPAWVFVLQRIALWLGIILFLVVGAAAWGIIWFSLGHFEVFFFLKNSPREGLKALWLGLPVLWVVLLVFSGIITVFLTQKTKKGYRIAPIWWLVGLIGLQMVLGWGILASNAAERLENRLERLSERYPSANRQQEKRFFRPENGFLPGKVIQVQPKLRIRDPKGKTWTISGEVPKNIKRNQRVLVNGEKMTETTFKAEHIRAGKPMNPPEFKKRKE